MRKDRQAALDAILSFVCDRVLASPATFASTASKLAVALFTSLVGSQLGVSIVEAHWTVTDVVAVVEANMTLIMSWWSLLGATQQVSELSNFLHAKTVFYRRR